MIAKFFSKTKPIHFVIVTSVLFITFSASIFFNDQKEVDVFFFFKQGLLFVAVFLSLFIFDFLTGKNNLTKKNSYHLLLYSLLIILIPNSFLHPEIIVSNMFVLFALRRIISLRSKKFMKKKLFDAAFWITLATLLCFWTSLFYILIFVALFILKVSDVKNWIIPFLGVLTVVIIGYMFLIIFKYPFMPIAYYIPEINFDFSSMNDNSTIIASTIFLTYFIWALFFYLKNLKSKSKNYKASYILILAAALIAITIVVLKPDKSSADLLFMVAPLSIIVANYLELINEKWFKEVLIGILMISPFVSLLL